MALADRTNLKEKTPDSTNGERENLWASVLSEVQTDRDTQLPTSKSLLVVGDKESGKTTLIAKIQGNEDPKKGAGLEYHYIDVRDEYRDDHTRLGVWTLDGDPSHVNLLRFSLTEDNFTDTTVVFTVSMTTPWNIMDQLQTWASMLQDHIDKLALSAERTKGLQRDNIRRWQSYVEPGDEAEASSSPAKRVSRNLGMTSSTTTATSPNGEADGDGIGGTGFGEDELLPLPENTLTRNLGLDLIVVVTKTDCMADLERDYDYKEEHFDFIQQSVRKFCLQYGAALFYASVKEDKNCDVLYKYLVHRIYGFPFKTPALVVEKDAVFIPAGWDNEKKVAILYENMHSVNPDHYYTDVIARPMIRKVGASARDLEVVAEDEQQFLLRQQQYLQQGAAPPPVSGMTSVQKTPDRKNVGSPGVQGSPKKVDASKVGGGPGGAAATSEGVLANFFNSLLSKKTGGAAGGAPGAPGVGGSPGGVGGMGPNGQIMGASPGGVAGGGSPGGIAGSGAQLKAAGDNDELKAASVRNDAAAELDRLTRGSKKSTVAAPNALNNNDTSGGGGEAKSLNSSEC